MLLNISMSWIPERSTRKLTLGAVLTVGRFIYIYTVDWVSLRQTELTESNSTRVSAESWSGYRPARGGSMGGVAGAEAPAD